MSALKDKLPLLFGLLAAFSSLQYCQGAYPYYGTKIGALTRLHHGVSGDVYAVDSRTIFIKKFNYDGEAPAAYFYVGNTARPSNEGAIRLRDERGGNTALTRRYRNKDITLSLPDDKTLRDIKWFSVWCDEFAVNFGDVSIPNNLDFPRPQKISALRGVHGVSSDNIVIVDAQTLLVPNFSYDGEAPDAKFWVGRGQRPTSDGLRIPDENGKENALRRYDRKTIVLTLPEDLTIFDIGHFGVWCEAFTVDFGHVRLPEGLNVPPSLKMLGISPQSKLNCEVLHDDLAFEVRWAVAGESIVVQLVAKLESNNYMAFGISPNKTASQMVGADAVVAWVDPETGNGFAQDYFLDGQAQCSGGRGACPDTKIQEKTNSIRLLNAAMVNGYSIVTYQRSLAATDRLDLPISIKQPESVVWAIGPLNDYQEVSFHTFYNKHFHPIEFGRQPKWNCPLPEGAKPGAANEEDELDSPAQASPVSSTGGLGYPPAGRPNVEPEEEFYENRPQALQRPTTPGQRPESNLLVQRQRPVPTPKPASSNGAWDIPAIQCHEPEDGVFYAQMGPTGGKHGYPAITGHVGWGISWYINGLLIPEIHVVRGKTYTFVVEGGNNPDIPAKYHPFYITDDPVGGYEHKREEEKKAVRIFAGVHRSRSGQLAPTGVGRLCNWTPDVDGPPADDYQSFGAYQRTLTLKCDAGEPGVITWKPDRNTPDTVYYHCFTHRYLGWKIHVHDDCDGTGAAASERHEVRVPAAAVDFGDFADADDFAAESSIRHETKVSPNDNFLLKHQTDLIKNHNMNGTPPKLSFEITKSSEITKLISDGIRAAEALEESILRNQSASNTAALPSVPSPPSTGHNHRTKATQTTLLAASRPTEMLQGETHENSIANHKLTQTPKLPIFAAPHSHLIPNAHLHQRLHHTSHSHPLFHIPPHLHHLHASLAPIVPLAPHIHHHANNLTNNLPALAQKTISLSEFLRPPQNAPLFHPVKLPGRRPYPGPIKKVPASRPVLPQQLPASGVLGQPSLIVNHYRKPVPGLLKPFLKEKPFPIQPIAASVLLLGQPTELEHGHRKTDHVKPNLSKPIPPVPFPLPIPAPVPVAYSDLETQSSSVHGKTHYASENKQPAASTTTGSPIIKLPTAEEPSAQQIASMRPAINLGFMPDSVVVESGFRPIIRNDGSGVQLPPELAEQVAHRREDAGSEIDEAMETDTLFLTAAQHGSETQSFEPMFIPSPLDSTNATTKIMIKKVTASALRLPSAAVEHSLPTAAKLRKPTLEELFGEEILDETVADDTNEEDEGVQSELEEEEPLIRKPVQPSSTPKTTTKTTPSYDDMESLFEDEEEEEALSNEETDDKMAQAAERIDTYYLPPDNRKIPHASLPSGAVYTFDGKSVVDSTLVLPPKLDSRDSGAWQRPPHFGLSPLEQLIRTTPQFGAYRGELPPIPEEFLSTERNTLFPNVPTVTEHSSPVTLTEQRNRATSALANSGSTSSTISTTSSIHLQSSSALPLSSTSSLRPISTKLHLLKPDNQPTVNNNNNST